MTSPHRLAPIAAALLLAACGSGEASQTASAPAQSEPATTQTALATDTPVPTATPTAASSASASPGSAVPANDPNGAVDVAALLYPAEGTSCGAHEGGYASCPGSSRLLARLEAHPVQHAEQLCRCQGVWQSRTFTSTPTASGGIAHVLLNFGAATIAIDVAVLRSSAGWLADDTQCSGGGPSTSIYVENPPPC